ncbi:MAG: hypothetical protein IJA72_03550, partial [Clostridia bacterium]|nr:hypothetical protein [Clostridia bacterium]
MSEIFYMSEIFAEKLQTIAENVPKVYNKGFEDGNKGKIQVWQSNTEYEVGDVVIANFEEDLELADILFQ